METHNSNWNEERTGRLESLYHEGLSFTEIAADIGVSRSAAIGKAHRMHLPKRDAAAQYRAYVATTSRPGKGRRRDAVRVQPPLKPAPVIIPDHDYSCTIIELTDTTCRFPLWGVGDEHPKRRYCGRPGASLSSGAPYCRRCSRLAWPQHNP
jgi:GcrA cell cycle regulator